MFSKQTRSRKICMLLFSINFNLNVFPNTISEFFDSITMSFSISKNVWYLVNLLNNDNDTLK